MKTTRTLQVCMAIAFGLAFAISLFHLFKGPDMGVGLSSFEDAPAGATNISYWYGPIDRFLEFNATKIIFERWVDEKGFTHGFDPWTGKPYDELNYVKSVYRIQQPSNKIYSMEISDEDIWISNRGKNGGGYTVAFFPKQELVVYEWSSH